MKRRNFLWYSLLFTVSCVKTANPNPTQSVTTLSRKLKFAVTDINNIEKLQQDFGAFRKALAEVVGVEIELFNVENYTSAASSMLSGELDLVFAGPSEYLVLSSRAKAIPIVAIRRPNYHSIFVVNAKSKITSLRQLKGKTIAMRQVGSTSGHIFPIKMLMDAGLDPKKDVKIVMLHDKGIHALKKGEVDAWVIASDRYKNVLKKEGVSNDKEFSIIAEGKLLPSDVFMLNNQLASFVEDIRSRMLNNQDKLIKSLLISQSNQRYNKSQLLVAKDADYDVIRKVYQELGEGNFL
ncbi:phosphate/phosphite/phosphonate ABC transporter substrate-binding protein [Scytonema sp. UIC 10036]|nr:phosphate/phosphite/phosphonate ABC transporter substrate-binding protein [Scytonema sp. UIC 10036]